MRRTCPRRKGPALAPVARADVPAAPLRPLGPGLRQLGHARMATTMPRKLTRDTGGFVIGADAERQLFGSGDWRFGIAGGYTDDSLKVRAGSRAATTSRSSERSMAGRAMGRSTSRPERSPRLDRHAYEPLDHLPRLQRRGELELWRLCGARLRRGRLSPALPWDALVLCAGPLGPQRRTTSPSCKAR